VPPPRFLEVEAGFSVPLAGREVALFVLSGRLAGPDGRDLLAGDAAAGPSADVARLVAAEKARLLLEERERGGENGLVRIGRTDLVGTGVAGITGVRILHRAPGGALLRLGPPPGARWIVSGLRAFAVLAGRFFLYEVLDASEPRSFSGGEGHVVPEPSRPVPLMAGNDSAVVVAFAAPDVAVSLG
jgi:hypothetical protein